MGRQRRHEGRIWLWLAGASVALAMAGCGGGGGGNTIVVGTLADGVDPQLDPAGLQDNGGPTETVALLGDSPAIAAIPPADCTDAGGEPLTTDQRGEPRPRNRPCDIGAYEVES